MKNDKQYAIRNSEIKLLLKNNEYCIASDEITIYKKKAAVRTQYLSTLEAMAVNFAHEIEHITSEKLKLQFYKYSKDDIEYHPQNITRKMINEYYIMKPLNSIEELRNLINTIIMSQISTNTTEL